MKFQSVALAGTAALGVIALAAACAGTDPSNSQPSGITSASPEGDAGSTGEGITADHRALPVPDKPSGNPEMITDYKVTMLADMVTNRFSTAEWGLSALVEVQSGGQTKRFLFDTGGSPNTVIHNVKQAVGQFTNDPGGWLTDISGKVPLTFAGPPASSPDDFCLVEDVILSHNHSDHTLGLNNLRATCVAAGYPNAFMNAYVGGEEIFYPRPDVLPGSGPELDDNVMVPGNVFDGGSQASDGTVGDPAGERALYLAQGGNFIVKSEPTHAFLGLPGVWLTGQIPRNHDEKTYPGTPNIVYPDGGSFPDLMPEEHALVLNTAKGLVIFTGCAHAGIINTIERARAIVAAGRDHDNPSVTLAGGLHMLASPLGTTTNEGDVNWFGAQMAALQVNQVLGAHCTGFERLAYIRDRFLGLDGTHAPFLGKGVRAAFSTVGTQLGLSTGIVPLAPPLNNSLQ